MAVVTVEKNRYTVDSVDQWDVNHVLEIRGLSLPKAPEIHFTNAIMAAAIPKKSTMDAAGVITVTMPNSLLQKQYKIVAYVCMATGSSFETLYKIEIPVNARPRPADYTIEDCDEELYSFLALDRKLDETIETATKKYDAAVVLLNSNNDKIAKYDEDVVKYKESADKYATEVADIHNDFDEITAEIDTATENYNAATSAYNGAKTAYDDAVAILGRLEAI